MGAHSPLKGIEQNTVKRSSPVSKHTHRQTDRHTHTHNNNNNNTHTPPPNHPPTHTHLPCCCITHLPTACCRGGWDASRGARAQAYLQRTRETPPRRERSGSSAQWRHAAHDDSALYTQSKASQQQQAAMKPSRPRRGDSFT